MTPSGDLYIIKIGTHTLVDTSGAIRDAVITEVLDTARTLLLSGNQVLLVTSGAVCLGRELLGDKTLPKTLTAAVGQPVLFEAYQSKARKMNIRLAEFLITRPYIVRRPHFLALQKNFSDLLALGIIPVVNENDALVSGTDWSFGDNDGLGATLAVALGAKKFIMVSHIDGLYDSDPTKNKNAKRIESVDNIAREFLAYCSKETSHSGTGGMLSKLKAARICTAAGIETRIVNGTTPGALAKAVAGESIGTIFHARTGPESISNRIRWILAAKGSTGSIEVDDGAEKALRSGMSLLAVGVKKVYGQFAEKEVIEIVNKHMDSIAFGIVDFSGEEIEGILQSKDIQKKQLIHANNLFVFK